MSREFLALLLGCWSLMAQSAELIWQETFDDAGQRALVKDLEQVPGRGRVLHITVSAGTPNPGRTVVLPVPLERLRGQRVLLGADVKTSEISEKPNSWNGVKLMAVVQTPTGTSYPQPEIPVGTTDWRRFCTSLAVPENATNMVVVLGLEKVSGTAWFDNVSIRLRAHLEATLKVDAARPVFRGHSLPRLRGAMAGTNLKEEDVKHFGSVWHGNLLRLQIFEAARKDRSLDEYDNWLDGRLTYIDQVLGWCEKYGVMAVIDLHSPPGGQAFSGGYITARGQIFTDPHAQAKFIEVWQKMTRRYKGRATIWGFDLVNEPDDANAGEDCLDWNRLADKTARAVRAIDPERTLIIEPSNWGGPQGFAGFEPLDLPKVVYSFHFYEPMQFTHQGIYNNPKGIDYPGRVGNQQWNKEALEAAMRPAIEFSRKYRVQMYVGEFSAIRTAPDGCAARYLADVIGIFEKHGFDWSYHAYREWQGWSLEHEGPLDRPAKAQAPTDRERVVTEWYAKNGKS